VSTLWEGPEPLAGMLVPIAGLKPHPKNRRKGRDDRVAESLTAFGQLKPVVVNKGNVLLAGHHLVLAAQTLGWTHVAAVQVNVPAKVAERYLIADNRTSDLATWDETGLLADLKAMETLDGVGFTPEEINLLALKVADRLDIEPEPGGDGDGGGGSEHDYVCPECGHGWSGSPTP
jgi:ParB-like chromosome segregation protein Spo0J